MEKLYGIWIKKVGWLKVAGKVVCFADIDVADDTAWRVSGEVRFIDESLKDLEQNILSLESMPKWWQIWRRK